MSRIGQKSQDKDGNEIEERMRESHWTDRYRWPDKKEGWSGPLAGYPPDHKARKGQKPEEWQGLSPKKIAELEQIYKHEMGMLNTPEEKAVKMKLALAIPGVKRASSIYPVTETTVTKTQNVTENTHVTEIQEPVTEIKKRGRPKKDGALSGSERVRLHRQREAKDKFDQEV